MKRVLKQSFFIFPWLFFIGSNSYSQNGRTSYGFTSGKDVFGTRVFIENKKQFNNAIKNNDKILYALEN